jgi:hypothetical protein
VDKFDTALILSGDSDLAPVTTKLKELCPGKKIGIIVLQNQSTMNLKQHADFFKKIQDRDLKKSLLSEQITYNDNIITALTGGVLLRHRQRQIIADIFDEGIIGGQCKEFFASLCRQKVLSFIVPLGEATADQSPE